MQLPLLPPESDWKPPTDWPDWHGAKRIAFDLETYDPNLKETGPSVRTGGHIAGWGFAIEGGPKVYLPVRHANGENLDSDNVLRYFKHQFKNFDGELVGANLAYDLDWAWAEGVGMPGVKAFRDVLVAEPCINENKFYYSLDSVAKDWLGEQKEKALLLEGARAYGLKKESELGAYIHLLPAKYVGLYAEQDCALPLKILRLQEEEIVRQQLGQVWDLESRLLPVLVKMRQRGVRVDEDKLVEMEILAYNERIKASEYITRETDVTIGPEDAMQKGLLVKALRAAGHDLDADDSVDQHFINTKRDCKVVSALGDLRKWDTLRKLSIDPVKKHLHYGRIHCSFNQMAKDDGSGGTKGARYGRLSCEHVNMQQQPSRGGADEASQRIAREWRKIYLPDPEKLWASCDYSQQEPRLLVHWAETVAKMNISEFPMRGARTMADRYRTDPDADNHEMMARLTYGDDTMNVADKAEFKKMRDTCKILFLGLTYEMGGPALCSQLGLPTKVVVLRSGPRKGEKFRVAGDKAQGIMDRLDASLPFLREIKSLCKEQADTKGYIRTLLGRKCRFRMGEDGLNYWGTYKALNRLIQGSAADQTKKAMVEADKAGFNLQLQVHDELCLSVENREEAEGVAGVMQDCVKLEIPVKVDVEIGKSWGDSMT